MEAPQDPPSRDAASLTSALVPIASDAERVADVCSAMDVETSPNALFVDVVLPTMSLPPVALKAGQVTQDAFDEAALLGATFEVSQKGKGQVS